MKKIAVLACALAFSLGFIGCSSDDSDGGISKADLAGKWNYVTYKQTVEGQEFIAEEPYSGNDSDCEKDFIKFNEDDTAVMGDWTFDCDPMHTYTSWSLAGKKVMFMMDGEHVEYKVVSVSATQLTLTHSESDFGITAVETYTFSKGD